MRYLLFLVLLLIPSTGGAALTATVDPAGSGRVTLTSSATGSTYQWYKDGSLFATTATNTAVDYRPNKNYKYYPAQDSSCVYTGSWSNSYNASHRSTSGNAKRTTTNGNKVTITTPPCVEVGVLLDPYWASGLTSSTSVAVKLDGVSQGSIIGDMSNTSTAQISVVRWGKNNLTLAPHTIELTLSGSSLTFDGYWVSDRNVALGSAVTYSVTVDGSDGGSTVAYPSINRAAVLSAQVDQMAAVFAGGTIQYMVGYEFCEYMGGLAMAKIMTGRSELDGYANTIYNGYMANADANGLLTNQGTGSKHIVLNGRIGYDYWLAYKAFGDSRYLAVLDKVVGTFRDNAKWPRSTVSYNSTTYPNVWAYTNSAGSAPYPDGNQWAAAALSCALAYNEPASAWYHDATLLTLIQANIDWSYTVYNPSTGVLWYHDQMDKWPAWSYGTFQWIALQYVADTLGYRTTDAAKVLNWLTTGWSLNEPWFQDDSQYDTIPNAETMFWQFSTFYRKNGTLPSDFVDIAYSGAITKAPQNSYVPAGGAVPTATMDSLLWRFFWGAIPDYLFNVPLSVYGAASSSIAAKYAATMRASFR